jgi:hypothetical protein
MYFVASQMPKINRGDGVIYELIPNPDPTLASPSCR